MSTWGGCDVAQRQKPPQFLKWCVRCLRKMYGCQSHQTPPPIQTSGEVACVCEFCSKIHQQTHSWYSGPPIDSWYRVTGRNHCWPSASGWKSSSRGNSRRGISGLSPVSRVLSTRRTKIFHSHAVTSSIVWLMTWRTCTDLASAAYVSLFSIPQNVAESSSNLCQIFSHSVLHGSLIATQMALVLLRGFDLKLARVINTAPRSSFTWPLGLAVKGHISFQVAEVRVGCLSLSPVAQLPCWQNCNSWPLLNIILAPWQIGGRDIDSSRGTEICRSKPGVWFHFGARAIRYAPFRWCCLKHSSRGVSEVS